MIKTILSRFPIILIKKQIKKEIKIQTIKNSKKIISLF
jgi:hypothetical protein